MVHAPEGSNRIRCAFVIERRAESRAPCAALHLHFVPHFLHIAHKFAEGGEAVFLIISDHFKAGRTAVFLAEIPTCDALLEQLLQLCSSPNRPGHPSRRMSIPKNVTISVIGYTGS